MAGTLGSRSRSGDRSPSSEGASRDVSLKILASFPDLERAESDRDVPIGADEDRQVRPRIGWGSIAILAVVAAAVCTAAWWIDRGPIDPSAAEIARVRLAEKAMGAPASPIRTTMNTTMKMKKNAKR